MCFKLLDHKLDTMGAAASTECGTTAHQVRSTVLNGKPLDASDIQVCFISICSFHFYSLFRQHQKLNQATINLLSFVNSPLRKRKMKSKGFENLHPRPLVTTQGLQRQRVRLIHLLTPLQLAFLG